MPIFWMAAGTRNTRIFTPLGFRCFPVFLRADSAVRGFAISLVTLAMIALLYAALAFLLLFLRCMAVPLSGLKLHGAKRARELPDSFSTVASYWC
jgi:hypothetical protein